MTRMLHLAGAHQPLSTLLLRQLDEVALTLERQLASNLSAVNALCRHVEQYRGKMLRPTMVLLSGLAARVGNPSEDEPSLTDAHRTVAAVVEMIHMATLVHDDVLDDAKVRRRGATINHLRGNEIAVMLGDYLISNSFHLCSTLNDSSINLALGEVTNTICEGELLQLHHRDDYSIDEATYFEIVRRKTASLIGESCRLGAKLSGAGVSAAESLRHFGESLGVAFQIQDDLLDLIGDESVVGKSLGQDLNKGKLTLPLIVHLAQASQRERGEALRLIERRDAARLRPLLIESAAVRASLDAAMRLVDDAKMKLATLPESPARHLLDHLAEKVVHRSA